MSNYNILILGASYGSLLASKILFGGHSVKLVCLPAEANLINSEGFRVRIPVRGRDEQIELDSRKLPGRVSAAGADDVSGDRRFLSDGYERWKAADRAPRRQGPLDFSRRDRPTGRAGRGQSRRDPRGLRQSAFSARKARRTSRQPHNLR